MVYSLTYRRPPHVDSARSSVIRDEKTKSISETSIDTQTSGSSGMPSGIPDALSFDRIITGGTCPPCTTRDFMNYLIYIEHSAENLQFYLWYRDYLKRFNELPSNERALAPEWSAEQAELDAQGIQGTPGPKQQISAETAAVFKGTEFAPPIASVVEVKGNPFNTPPRTPNSERTRDSVAPSERTWSENGSTLMSNTNRSFQTKTAGAFQGADLKWQPFTIQPFREELSRVIAIYIADGAPRQLNLSAKERTNLLHALANTTHPTAFRVVVHTVEWSLRHQAHPNFIRWTICNGNRPRVIFARGLGVSGILGGIICAVLITLSNAGRGWRALSAIGFMIGVATLIAAWKGMCVVLHGMHHRHLRPWELFAEDDFNDSSLDLGKGSFDTLGSANSYEDEPWVAKYEKRNIIRKVFDREVWIQEPALRQIQDTIFVQALGGALIITAVSVGIFCALPKGNYY